MTRPITGSAYAAVVRTTSRQLGAPLPAELEAALDQARAVRDGAAQPEGSSANEPIVAALAAGRNWRSDKAIQALLFEQAAAAGGIRAAGADASERMICDAIAEHAEEVVASWAAALAPDIAALSSAAAAITVDEIERADVPSLHRRGLVDVWAAARAAIERVNTLLEGWGMIAVAAHIDYNRHYRALVLTAAPDILDRVEPAAGVWAVARTGAALDIAGPAQYRQRVAAHEAALATRRQEAEQEHQRAVKAVLRG